MPRPSWEASSGTGGSLTRAGETTRGPAPGSQAAEERVDRQVRGCSGRCGVQARERPWWADSAALYERYDNAEKLDPADRIEHRLSTDPIDPIDSAEPIDPIESTEPVEAIESTEPVDAIDRNERSERQDRWLCPTALSRPR